MAEVNMARALEARQTTMMTATRPDPTNMMSIFKPPVMTGAGAPIATFMPSGTPAATAVSGSPFGNNRGGINQMKDNQGLSRGGIIAVSVIFALSMHAGLNL
jgi:hypothetical protein